MDEKKIPEVNAEELKDPEISEAVDAAEEAAEVVKTASDAAEAVENTDVTEEAEETAEIAKDAAADTEETKTAEETAADTEAAETAEEAADDTAPENAAALELDAEAAVQEAPAKKKKFPIQIPVIIAACIVLAALLGYFVFTGFFLREPEGVTWMTEIEGANYYCEFQTDGTFKGYLGSAEVTGSYEKTKSEEGNTITTTATFGNFYGNYPCTYEITGSRILGNQELKCSYGEGYDFTLTQGKREKVDLEVSNDFVADEELVGTWIFKYMGYDVYKATFDAKGYMSLELLQQGAKYNGTYTVENGTINFTYVVNENVTAPGEYSVDGDVLNYMGYAFVREGSDAEVATNDQIQLSE